LEWEKRKARTRGGGIPFELNKSARNTKAMKVKEHPRLNGAGRGGGGILPQTVKFRRYPKTQKKRGIREQHAPGGLPYPRGHWSASTDRKIFLKKRWGDTMKKKGGGV